MNIVIIVLAAILAFLYYYITIPAFNIHSLGTWWFLIGAVLFVGAAAAFRKFLKDRKMGYRDRVADCVKSSILAKIGFGAAAVLFVILVIGSLLSSPIINAKKYQGLMNVEERDFVSDISQVDYNTIPLLDKDSAALLGDRKMGSMVDMVSQFEVSEDYSQINLNNRPVRVSPLVYASPIKWLTNQREGIPAYIKIDMATQDTECVKLKEGIKYSPFEYLNRNIYRHLRFNYPTFIFADQIFFEIDEEGTPYWICPVKKFNIGLFGGETIGNVVICNAVTGECTNYDIKDVPQWVDKVYQAELLTGLYDYNGVLKHGFFNSILGQKDCLQTTDGYNYIALDDDIWVYSGVTSVSGDQSNVGFVLMNQRTMETRFYKIEGATEGSAMSSAEGQVQNLGYGQNVRHGEYPEIPVGRDGGFYPGMREGVQPAFEDEWDHRDSQRGEEGRFRDDPEYDAGQHRRDFPHLFLYRRAGRDLRRRSLKYRSFGYHKIQYGRQDTDFL